MAVLSVVVIAVVAAAYTFVPGFQTGVDALGQDVQRILGTGEVGGIGTAREGMQANGGAPHYETGPDLTNGGPMFNNAPGETTASANVPLNTGLGAPIDPVALQDCTTCQALNF